MKKIYLMLTLCAMLLFVSAPAQASPVELSSWFGYFESDHITGTYGKDAPFGSVLLEDIGDDVRFTVTLFDGSKFVRTGAGDNFDFKFNYSGYPADLAYTGTNITISRGIFDGDGGGMFHYGVYFTNQGTGGNNAYYPAGGMVFTILDTEILDFVGTAAISQNPNHPGALTQIFVADVLSGVNGLTGLVDVHREGEQVPEPTALILLGLGLVGLAGLRRFKK